MFPEHLAGGGIDTDDLLRLVGGLGLVADDRVKVLRRRSATIGRRALPLPQQIAAFAAFRIPLVDEALFGGDAVLLRAAPVGPVHGIGACGRRRELANRHTATTDRETSRRLHGQCQPAAAAVHGGFPANEAGKPPGGRKRRTGDWRVDLSRYSLTARSRVRLAAGSSVLPAVKGWRSSACELGRDRRAAEIRDRSPCTVDPCLLDQLYRHDTRDLARRPRPTGPHNRHDRQRFHHASAACKLTVTVALGPAAKNYLPIAFCRRSIRWMSHAMHPRASCGKQSARQLTGPDLIEPRIGSTGVDAQPWNPPSTSRLIPTPGTFKVPLTPVERIGSA